MCLAKQLLPLLPACQEQRAQNTHTNAHRRSEKKTHVKPKYTRAVGAQLKVLQPSASFYHTCNLPLALTCKSIFSSRRSAAPRGSRDGKQVLHEHFLNVDVSFCLSLIIFTPILNLTVTASVILMVKMMGDVNYSMMTCLHLCITRNEQSYTISMLCDDCVFDRNVS